MPIPDRYRATIEPYAGKPITLGVRPEHVRLTVLSTQYSVLSTQHSIVIPATVEAVERLGAESHVYLKSGDQAFIARTESNVRPGAPGTPGRGEQVLAAVLPEHLHFFDAASETAIRTPASA